MYPLINEGSKETLEICLGQIYICLFCCTNSRHYNEVSKEQTNKLSNHFISWSSMQISEQKNGLMNYDKGISTN